MFPNALRRTMPALLTCLGLLAAAGPAAALNDRSASLDVASPCDKGEECSCPSDPHNYLTDIPGYVEECRNAA